MSVKSVVLIAAAAALSSAVVAANIARSGAVAPYQAKADFDQAVHRRRRFRRGRLDQARCRAASAGRPEADRSHPLALAMFPR